jgi:O-acetyl-ADP-ribose deacetylase (regulator of RNase III)
MGILNYSTLIIKGNITTAKVDVMVNAANRELIPGGGVDGAIHRAAGPQLEHEVHQYAPLEIGKVVITSGYHLPSSYVMHVVGPKWYDYLNKEDAKDLLRKTYQAIVDSFLEQGYTSIAIPNISTGVYGFPKEEAVRIVYDVMNQYQSRLKDHHKVYFYCFDEENYRLYCAFFKNA